MGSAITAIEQTELDQATTLEQVRDTALYQRLMVSEEPVDGTFDYWSGEYQRLVDLPASPTCFFAPRDMRYALTMIDNDMPKEEIVGFLSAFCPAEQGEQGETLDPQVSSLLALYENVRALDPLDPQYQAIDGHGERVAAHKADYKEGLKGDLQETIQDLSDETTLPPSVDSARAVIAMHVVEAASQEQIAMGDIPLEIREDALVAADEMGIEIPEALYSGLVATLANNSRSDGISTTTD